MCATAQYFQSEGSRKIESNLNKDQNIVKLK